MNFAKILLALCVFVGVAACEGGKDNPEPATTNGAKEGSTTKAGTTEGTAEEGGKKEGEAK